jgi:hypothetical protein
LVRALDSGDWKEKTITKEQFLQLLKAKIESISFISVRNDVARFIHNDKDLDIWSTGYFKDLTGEITFR